MKIYILVFQIILFIILIQNCSHEQLVPEFIDDPITRVDLEPILQEAQNTDRYSHYNLLILLEKVIYQLKPDGKIIFQVHQVMKVLNDQKGGLGKSFIYYREGYEKITRIEAYTITRDNKRVTATEISIRTPFFNSFIQLDLYKDIRVMTISLPRVEKGSILNLRYQMEIVHSDVKGILDGEFYLANRFPILKQKGVIIVPKGKKVWFKHIKTNLRAIKTTKEKEDYYVIKQSNSPIIQKEFLQPPFQEISPKIIFSTLKSWKELNKKIYPIISSGLRDEKVVYHKAIDLTKNAISKRKKIEILYNFVTNTNNISNVAIPFGITGYIPHSSSKILMRRYGNSIDKVILLANLLRSVGIDSKIALTNEISNFDPDIPSLKSINRILLAIPFGRKYQYLDPYSAIVRYSYLPSNNYGKRVIILDSKKPHFTKIPILTSEENQIIYKTESSLTDKGILKYTTHFIPKGSYEVNERANMIKIKLKNKFRSLIQNYKSVYEISPKIKLLDLKSPNPFDITRPFRYSVTITISDYPLKKSRLFLVQPELHRRKLFSLSRHRTHDLDFILPFKVTSKHKMKYPSTWKVKKLPKNIKISSSMWNYVREFKTSKNNIHYLRQLEVKVSKIKKHHYLRFKKFIDRVIKSDKEMIHFVALHKSDTKNVTGSHHSSKDRSSKSVEVGR